MHICIYANIHSGRLTRALSDVQRKLARAGGVEPILTFYELACGRSIGGGGDCGFEEGGGGEESGGEGGGE